MKHVFIINSQSAEKKRKRLTEEIHRLFPEDEAVIEVTDHPGHAKQLARQYASEGTMLRIYACGGDGTLHEVVNGVLGFSHVQVAVIPIGTGNDFIKAFPSYRPQDFLCLENYQDAKLAKSDVLMVDEEASINTVSAGLDVKVAYHVDKFKQLPFAHGVFPYFLGLLVSMAGSISEDLIVEIDGRREAFSDYLFVDLATDNNPQTIVMMATVGGFVALIEKSGGARAFAKAVANSVNSKVKAQLAAWLGGLVIFFSDSGNSLILGPMFRPIFDRLKASRAKLSYILDSTSSPVCILIPITGWGVYIMSIIATEFETLGINGSDASTFMAAIPYQFYSILALFLIPIVAFGRHDFGFMAKAEEQARLGLPQNIADDEAILVSDDKKVSPWNMILPLGVLLGTILVMFVSWGFPFQNIPGSKIRIALTSGYLLASIVCMIMITAQKLMSFKETFDVFIGGIQKMGSVLVVVVLAWGVGSVCKDLGTSQFIVDSTLGLITPHVVPALLFLVGVIISFATGTSWGAMAILLPIGINMAVGFGVSIPMTIGAVLSGCLFGDHCSPISDTTVMSAMAAGCDLLEHTRTQLPYAGIAALASFVAYLILGFTNANIWIMLVVALALLIVFYLLSCRLWGVKAAESK